MLTTCPECRTTFRVGQDHLAQRRGLVRCGQCRTVFNAYDTLLPELEEPASDAAPEIVEASPPVSAREPDSLPMQAMVERNEGMGDLPTLSTLTETAPEPVPLSELETPDAILLSDLPTRRPARRIESDIPANSVLPFWKTAVYWLVLLTLGIALALQLTYFLRAELAAAWPESRVVLETGCEILGCSVPLPRQLSRQAIISSHLEHDPEQTSRVQLTLLLANRTGQAQAWPDIMLTLSDVRDTPVARKRFPPKDYLPAGAHLKTGMAASGEKEIRLDLDIGNLAASGYVLNLVYP